MKMVNGDNDSAHDSRILRGCNDDNLVILSVGLTAERQGPSIPFSTDFNAFRQNGKSVSSMLVLILSRPFSRRRRIYERNGYRMTANE